MNPATVASMIGRTAARLGTLAWPDDDDVTPYVTEELHRIGVEHGGGHAVERVAAAYVKHMGEKRRELTGERLRSSWQGFCKTAAREG